jgi:hypothetical protein
MLMPMSVILRAMNSMLIAVGVAAVLVLWGGSARAELRVDTALKLRISMILSYKAACDQSTPGYAVRMSAIYAKWSAPRAAAIERIEADPEFQRQKAEMVRQASQLTVATGDPRQDADRPEQAANFRALCETHLPNELLGAVTEYTNSPGPHVSPAGAPATTTLLSQGASTEAGSVTVAHKSATHTAGGMSASPVPTPGPTPP